MVSVVRTILSAVLLFSCMDLYAYEKGPAVMTGLSGDAVSADSLLPVRTDHHSAEDIMPDLQDVETDYRMTRDHRRALARLLKIARVRMGSWNMRGRYRLYNDLAGVAVKLKLYPLAMKCYDRAVAAVSVGEDNSFFLPDSNAFAQDNHTDDMYGMLTADDTSSLASGYPVYGVKSMAVGTCDIWESFDDGKKAVSYAMMVHAKQPVPGKRKSYCHINNVGHLFITLIKYNADNSFVSRSFGFYPRKTSLFSGTPVHPRSAAVFKDDALHDWDEVVGKFISFKKFQKIIGLLKEYDRQSYNLNSNNCTDFGLSVAAIGGISVRETRGVWPLGRGNNPANAGQSLLEGKWSNTDADYHGPVFACNNIQSFPGAK